MNIAHEKVIKELALKQRSNKHWWFNSNLKCPFCGKKDKMDLLFSNSNMGVASCFYCKRKVSVKDYLIAIGRYDLIDSKTEPGYDWKSALLEKIEKGEKVEKRMILELPEIEMPTGFIQVNNHFYLKMRKWQPYHDDLYKPGVIDGKYPYNSFIFIQIPMNGKTVGYFARSLLSKKEFDSEKEKYNQGVISRPPKKVLNSSSEFRKILFGYDEITNRTETVIIVEGVFDKIGCDVNGKLWESPKIKAVATFGSKISYEQIAQLKKSGIDQVILFYDLDAQEYVIDRSYELEKHFSVVEIMECPSIDKDPNDLTSEEFQTAYQYRKPASEYQKFNFPELKRKVDETIKGVL